MTSGSWAERLVNSLVGFLMVGFQNLIVWKWLKTMEFSWSYFIIYDIDHSISKAIGQFSQVCCSSGSAITVSFEVINIGFWGFSTPETAVKEHIPPISVPPRDSHNRCFLHRKIPGFTEQVQPPLAVWTLGKLAGPGWGPCGNEFTMDDSWWSNLGRHPLWNVTYEKGDVQVLTKSSCGIFL